MAGHVIAALHRRQNGFLLAFFLLLSAALAPATSALALTEPKRPSVDSGQTVTEPAKPGDGIEDGKNSGVVPLPDPLVKTPGDTLPPQDDDLAQPEDDKPANVEVIYDISKAPEPVIRMRELIVEAAASGDVERLRPLMKYKDGTTRVTLGDEPDDPIATLKGLSGDAEGRELLAILLDVLATGFVHIDAGTTEEAYVWPYFTEKQLDKLSPPEVVELLRIVTAGDMADMKEFGGYNFYRVGISPTGEWKFFVAGD